MSGRRRLDLELVRRGLVESRSRAQELIAEGKVLVGGAPTDNSARQVSPAEPLKIVAPRARFVGRGGEKLQHALSVFDIEVAGKRTIDVGASTGGFTDCLLQSGAESVVALDVGHGQLHERIRCDARVDVRERMNVRNVTLADFDDQPFDVVVADLSFISLRTVASALVGVLAAPGADLVVLVKPQFEAGRVAVSKGKGIVRDPEIWKDALNGVVIAMGELGAATMGVVTSPILGAEGNVEFLAWLNAGQDPTAVSDATATLRLDELVTSAAAAADPETGADVLTADPEAGA